MDDENYEGGAGGPVRRNRQHSRGATPYNRYAHNGAPLEIQPDMNAVQQSAAAVDTPKVGWTGALRRLAATPSKFAGMLSNTVRSDYSMAFMYSTQGLAHAP